MGKVQKETKSVVRGANLIVLFRFKKYFRFGKELNVESQVTCEAFKYGLPSYVIIGVEI